MTNPTPDLTSVIDVLDHAREEVAILLYSPEIQGQEDEQQVREAYDHLRNAEDILTSMRTRIEQK